MCVRVFLSVHGHLKKLLFTQPDLCSAVIHYKEELCIVFMVMQMRVIFFLTFYFKVAVHMGVIVLILISILMDQRPLEYVIF